MPQSRTLDICLSPSAVIKPSAPQALKATFSIGAKPSMADATSETVAPSPLRYCSVASTGMPRTAAPLARRAAFWVTRSFS